MKGLFIALGFLSIIPVREKEPIQPSGLGEGAVWFPLVGLMIGCVLAGVRLLLNDIFSSYQTAAWIVIIWVIITGGLHLDGLADSVEGMVVAFPKKERLKIMRDPHLGTFGIITIVLYLVLKILVIAELEESGSFFSYILATTLARWVVLIVAVQKTARDDGIGTSFSHGIGFTKIASTFILPLVLIIISGIRGMITLLVVLLFIFGVINLAKKQLGGVTGDIMGMGIEMTEIIVLIMFAI